MSSIKQTKIGNENFKNWLKKLDPLSRVEMMSSIAKTQASAGLKSSLIKASLAQLSQKCHVMLIKLTDKDIKKYTRRKPVKRLVGSDVTNNETKNSKISVAKLPSSNKGNLKKVGKYDSISNNEKKCRETSLQPKGEPKSISQDSKPENDYSKLCASSSTNSDSGRKFSKKLKKKFQMLFGSDDLPSNTTKSIDNNIKNYLATTVNVNIYNSSSTDNGIDTSVFNGNVLTENCVPRDKDQSNKRLRIDVSLSNNSPSDYPAKQIKTMHDNNNTLKKCEGKEKVKSVCKTQKRHRESYKTKRKYKNNKMSSLTNEIMSLKDGSKVNEMWSQLGLESPTDRSESIIRSYPDIRSEETITLHKAPSENETTVFPNNINQQLSKDLKTGSQIPLDPLQKSLINKDVEDSTPVCKIVDAFSLATVSVENSSLPEHVVHYAVQKESTKKEEKIVEDKECNKLNTTTADKPEIETISLDDDDNESVVKLHNNVSQASNKNPEVPNQNKIGSIRVKNLGALMDPVHIATDTGSSQSNETNIIPQLKINLAQQKTQQELKQSLDQEHANTQERFTTTYKHYFNEYVEKTIPNLGELLHLAIADSIRRNERIKRAEQLSSDDLIKEEKQRAEKDFNDMMKCRGAEFTPLCESIIGSFDILSRKSLFFVLFYRLLKHAETIDPANRSNVLEAKNVILLMLQKHQFKEKEIIELLQNKPQDFSDQVKIVGDLTEKAICNINLQRLLPMAGSSTLQNLESRASPIKHVYATDPSKKPAEQSTLSKHIVGTKDLIKISPKVKFNLISSSKNQNYSKINSTKTNRQEKIQPNNITNVHTILPKINTTTNESQISHNAANGTMGSALQTVLNGKQVTVIASASNAVRNFNHVDINSIQRGNDHLKWPYSNSSQINKFNTAQGKNTTNSNQTGNKQNLSSFKSPTNVPNPSITLTVASNVVVTSSNQTISYPSTVQTLGSHYLTQQTRISNVNKTLGSTTENATKSATNKLETLLRSPCAPPISIGLVNVSQPTYTVQSYHPTRQIASTHPILVQRINTANVPSIIASKPNNINSPSINVSWIPDTSLNNSIRQLPVVITTVPSVVSRNSYPTASLGKQPVTSVKQLQIQTHPAKIPSSNNQVKQNIGSIIIRNTDSSSSPAIVGMDPNNFPPTGNNKVCQSQTPAKSDSDNLIPESRARVESATTSNSRNDQTPETQLAPASTNQTHLPSASHCHPFGKRMPISGKMRMLFDTN